MKILRGTPNVLCPRELRSLDYSVGHTAASIIMYIDSSVSIWLDRHTGEATEIGGSQNREGWFFLDRIYGSSISI